MFLLVTSEILPTFCGISGQKVVFSSFLILASVRGIHILVYLTFVCLKGGWDFWISYLLICLVIIFCPFSLGILLVNSKNSLYIINITLLSAFYTNIFSKYIIFSMYFFKNLKLSFTPSLSLYSWSSRFSVGVCYCVFVKFNF